MIRNKLSQRQIRKKYKTVNGCTKSPSLPQILSIVLMLTILVLQTILLGSITSIENVILNVLLAFSYLLLILVAYDYVKLITVDPVDPRLLELPFQERKRDQNMLNWCSICRADVHKYSYHCKSCNRCAEEFDHHCKYVNNCIGKKNYVNFFRIVISLTSFLLTQIGQGLWVLICIEGSIRRVGLALVILSGLIVPVLVYLAIFHCYISFWDYGTTLKYLKGDVATQPANKQQKLSRSVLIN